MKKPITEGKTDRINPPTSLLDVLRSIFKRKWLIAGLCAIVGIGSAIIVMLLPIYFKASTTFLAVSPDQATPELLFGTSNIRPELYGNANDIDRLMTIAESNELVDFMVDSFDLFVHYDINPEMAKARYYVRQEFFDLYEVKKTKRDALQLSIEDTDREQSAYMARVARERINQIAQQLIKKSQAKTISTFEENIEAKNTVLDILNDSLVNLREKYSIYNTVAQSEALSLKLSQAETTLADTKAQKEAYQNQPGVRGARDSIAILNIRISGQEEKINNVKGQLSLFNEGLSQVRNYEEQFRAALESLSDNQEKLKQYQGIYNSSSPAILLVEDAAVPIIKSRPRRTAVVLAAVFLTFFFSIVGILLFDTYREVNWREIYHGR